MDGRRPGPVGLVPGGVLDSCRRGPAGACRKRSGRRRRRNMGDRRLAVEERICGVAGRVPDVQKPVPAQSIIYGGAARTLARKPRRRDHPNAAGWAANAVSKLTRRMGNASEGGDRARPEPSEARANICGDAASGRCMKRRRDDSDSSHEGRRLSVCVRPAGPEAGGCTPSGFAEAVLSACSRTGFRCLNAKPYHLTMEARRLRDASGQLLWWRDDTHLSELGHETMAELIGSLSANCQQAVEKCTFQSYRSLNVRDGVI